LRNEANFEDKVLTGKGDVDAKRSYLPGVSGALRRRGGFDGTKPIQNGPPAAELGDEDCAARFDETNPISIVSFNLLWGNVELAAVVCRIHSSTHKSDI
jgi:hypothetical protein